MKMTITLTTDDPYMVIEKLYEFASDIHARVFDKEYFTLSQIAVRKLSDKASVVLYHKDGVYYELAPDGYSVRNKIELKVSDAMSKSYSWILVPYNEAVKLLNRNIKEVL